MRASAAALPNATFPTAAPPTIALHAGAPHTAVPPADAPMLLSGVQHLHSGANVGVGGRPQQACARLLQGIGMQEPQRVGL